MRIVQVSVGSVRMPPKEGSAPLQVIFSTSKHLVRMGHEVLILDRRYHRYDPPVERVEGVEIVRLRAPTIQFGRAPASLRFVLAELNAVLFALAVSRYLRENASTINVIHVHLTSIGLILATINRDLRGKMVYTCHLGEWELARKGLNPFEKAHLFLDPYLMRRVRRVVALSDSARDGFVTNGRVKPQNIAVVPNGVDADYFSPEVDARDTVAQYGLGGTHTVLFVGRLARIKGIGQLLEAANTVINDFGLKDMLFVIVGPGTFDAAESAISTTEIERFVRQHGLVGKVLITGPLPLESVRRLYAACDIFVLPSLAEGDPLVTLEAMASGKPVVATAVGGVPHQIRDGWNGFLVDPASEQQLADRIKYLIDNPDERRRMGANSRQRAEQEFGWGAVAQKLLAVYQS